MKQYIDKIALITEIERRIKEIDEIGTYLSPKGVLTNLLCHINALKVKEVDFEKETDKYISENFYGSETLGFFANRTKEEPNWKDIALCAKHFFELGLKAQRE